MKLFFYDLTLAAEILESFCMHGRFGDLDRLFSMCIGLVLLSWCIAFSSLSSFIYEMFVSSVEIEILGVGNFLIDQIMDHK